jgi:murein DD-endopeptidase MepM/ murein hydrolase activator NlpD
VTLEADGVIAELYFEGLRQGRAGLLRVTGAGVAEASGLFANRVVPFFADPDEPGAHYALLAVSMEQTPRAYALEIYATLDATGAAEIESPVVTLTTEVEVELGGFLGEAVDLPTEKAYLVSAEVERAEFARLSAVFEALPGAPAWDELGFQTPISAELTSRYGSVRTLNGTFPTRHTGWDLRAATGTPVRASAGGRVAFAGVLDIRGNHVIIDHGAGVFSGYSHLSQVFVTRGQQVVRDEIIGLSGNTGRSSGPHLHWEIAVNGEFIDSAEFADLWLP